jgi:glycosyltransferase involved in cell wall biosynthesis
MLIGIEATRANKPLKTGVEWYAWHLVQELKALTSGGDQSWALYSDAPLAGGLEKLPPNWYEIRLPWPLKYGWTQTRLSWELHRRAPDVLWMPGSTLPRVVPHRTVATVHDVGFHRFPEMYKPYQVRVHEFAMREIAKKAARILTVSAFSGREIAETYGIDPAKIAVTPLGVDHDLYRPRTADQGPAACMARYRLPSPFILAVGRIEEKKNIAMLVRAFTEYKTRRGVGEPLRLVLAGLPGYRYDAVQEEIRRSAFKSDILELGYVPEADMPCLLNAATALVFPSRYEGFGLPPLQAMASGCPVLSSNAASLPEVLGDAAAFFSPDEPEQLVALLEKLTDDATFGAGLRAKGLARAKSFTWRRTAELTLPALTQW